MSHNDQTTNTQIKPFQQLLDEFKFFLTGRAVGTVDVYLRITRQFLTWLALKYNNESSFQPEQFTRTALETYLSHLEKEGYSLSHRALVKAAAGKFATFLIEEKAVLQRNPARGVEIPAQPLLAPRELSEAQRFILLNLVERDGEIRSQALFALGYWAGCRVSDVSWLRYQDAHLTQKAGWLRVGHKGGKSREIDLVNQVRKPLFDYAQSHKRDPDSLFFFTSQRSDRLSEAGIHHWFRNLKAMANREEWEQIADISFHDLRHDFAHRARQAGWGIEEIAYYLGHITAKGYPAIMTTARYIQPGRQQIKTKLKLLRG